MTTTVNIYGENHKKMEEVNSIINKVIDSDPDIIVHELPWDDREIYLEKLGRDIVVPLETSKINYTKEIHDVPKRFSLREKDMLSNIRKAIENNIDGVVAVVIGDTHLRTKKTIELGKPSILHNLKKDKSLSVNIYRSSYIEID